MSGLDYTKKPEISNMRLDESLKRGHFERGFFGGYFSRLKDSIYIVAFLWRTRFEKWLLLTSFIFGLVGLISAGLMIKKINMPAELAINCDLETVKREVEIMNQGKVDESGEDVYSEIKNTPKAPSEAPSKAKKSPKRQQKLKKMLANLIVRPEKSQ